LLPHQTAASSYFSGAVAGEERRLLRGEFFAHTFFTLLFVLLYFILFYLHCFYNKNPKKLESLVVVISVHSARGWNHSPSRNP
jgi:hypothetical protein